MSGGRQALIAADIVGPPYYQNRGRIGPWNTQQRGDNGATAWLTAGAASSLPGADNDWTNPTNILSDDGSYAESNDPTNGLQGSSFGASLPTGSRVTGVEVRFQAKVNSPGSPRLEVSLYTPSTSQSKSQTLTQLTSAYPGVVLENFYLKSRNSIETGRRETPHGFVIPSEQPDRTRVALVVNLLRQQAIEVGRAKAAITLTDGTWPTGTYVVKGDQPYGRLAKILLEKQVFPDPSLRTYDDTAWTLGLMTHTDIQPIDDPAVLDVAVEPVATARASGTMAGERNAAAMIVPHHGANAMATLRYRLRRLKVVALDRPWTAGGLERPAGSFVIEAQQDGRSVVEEVRRHIEALGLDATGIRTMPDVPTHEVDIPRVAV